MTLPLRVTRTEWICGMVTPGAILVVHKDPQILRLVGRILGRAGYAVLQAHSGAEAVRLFDQHCDRIGLLLLDTVTPELSRLTADHPGLPLLGLSEPEGGQSFPFLLHPFTPRALLDAVRRALGPTRPPA